MKAWLKPYQQQFSALLEQGTLPHAILFYGMAGSGKQQLADWLVQLLLCQKPTLLTPENIHTPCRQCKCCLLFTSKTYPDHKEIISEKNSLGVDEIRAANGFLEKTAQFGNKKTVVIPRAETMTIAAANALLKTLEEPTDNSIIILLSSDTDSLLPTIISRCRLVAIRPPVGESLWSTDRFANISQLPELSDPNIKQQYEQFSQELLHYLYAQKGFETVVQQLVDNKNANRWFEKIIVNLIREHYAWQTVKPAFLGSSLSWLQQLDIEKLWQAQQFILAANKQLKLLTQASRPFVFEKLLIDCAEILTIES